MLGLAGGALLEQADGLEHRTDGPRRCGLLIAVHHLNVGYNGRNAELTMNETPIGRRAAVHRLLLVPAAIAVPTWFHVGCKSGSAPLVCNETAGLSPEDLKARVVTFDYVDTSPDPQKRCTACKQFRTAGEGQCGSCTIVKGPINPNGTCKSFAPNPP
jgi:hypothetical protein